MAQRWRELGTAVKHARLQAGLRTRDQLVKRIAERMPLDGGEGITSRTLGTLERGERVGEATLYLVAGGLGWPAEMPHRILLGEQTVGPAGNLLDDEERDGELRQPSIREASSMELLAELARRLGERERDSLVRAVSDLPKRGGPSAVGESRSDRLARSVAARRRTDPE